MAKYRIKTLATQIKKFYLTYEVEAESEEDAKSQFDETFPINEDLFDTYLSEEIMSIEKK